MKLLSVIGCLSFISSILFELRSFRYRSASGNCLCWGSYCNLLYRMAFFWSAVIIAEGNSESPIFETLPLLRDHCANQGPELSSQSSLLRGGSHLSVTCHISTFAILSTFPDVFGLIS